MQSPLRVALVAGLGLLHVACVGSLSGNLEGIDASSPAPRPDGGASDPVRTSDSGVAAASDAGVRPRDSGTPDVDPVDASGEPGPRDAGSAPADAGTTPTGDGCAGRDYLFCEDFESAAAGSLPTGWRVGGGATGTPQVTTAEHHGGTHALASGVGASIQRRAEHSLAMLGSAASTHWGRIFYKVATPAYRPSGGVVHSTFVAFPGGSNERRVVDTVVNGEGRHQWLYNRADDRCCTQSSYDWQYESVWHCAEWHVDSAAQSFQFFYEGTEVRALAFSGRADALIENFQTIAVGWVNYQNVPTMQYVSFFDDLAIDDERIGCE